MRTGEGRGALRLAAWRHYVESSRPETVGRFARAYKVAIPAARPCDDDPPDVSVTCEPDLQW